jgi:seryl-tRNA synthetase
MEKVLEINNEQNKYIESLQKYIKDNYTTKEESNKLDNQIKDLDKKIAEIDAELTKSNSNINNILFI